MGMFDSLKKVIGIEEIDDDFDDISEEEINNARTALNSSRERERDTKYSGSASVTPVSSAPGKEFVVERRLSVANTNALKLVVIEPKSFDECPKLVDSLKSKRPVIINLEKIETETAKKIFDFLNGATYALNGNVQRIASSIYIFAPESVDIAASQDDKGFGFNNKTKSPWR